MAKVITMGEIMLRLSTPNFEKFIQIRIRLYETHHLCPGDFRLPLFGSGSKKTTLMISGAGGNVGSQDTVIERLSILPCLTDIGAAEAPVAVFLLNPSHTAAEVEALIIKQPHRLFLHAFCDCQIFGEADDTLAFFRYPYEGKVRRTLPLQVTQMPLTGKKMKSAAENFTGHNRLGVSGCMVNHRNHQSSSCPAKSTSRSDIARMWLRYV